MPQIEVVQRREFNLHKITPKVLRAGALPVLIGLGFGSIPEQYYLLMEEFFLEGIPTLCPEYKYGWEGQPKRFGGYFPNVARYKSWVSRTIIDEEGFPDIQGTKQVDGFTHSKASIDFTPIARVSPYHFRTLIMDAASGVHPSWQRPFRVFMLRAGDHRDRLDKDRIITQGGEEAERLISQRGGADSFKWTRAFWEELLFGATKSVYRDFQILRDKGINVVVVAHEEDSMFPIRTYERLLGNDFIRMRGTHGAVKYDKGVCKDIVNLFCNPHLLSNS